MSRVSPAGRAVLISVQDLQVTAAIAVSVCLPGEQGSTTETGHPFCLVTRGGEVSPVKSRVISGYVRRQLPGWLLAVGLGPGSVIAPQGGAAAAPGLPWGLQTFCACAWLAAGVSPRPRSSLGVSVT